MARREILLCLSNLRALQMADLGRQPLDAACGDGERRKERRMPVARNDLRRDRLDGEPEFLRDMCFDPRIDIGEGADRAGNGAGRDLRARRDQPRTVAREFGVMPGELQPEGGRFGMDAVTAADADRVFVLEGAPLQRRQKRIEYPR